MGAKFQKPFGRPLTAFECGKITRMAVREKSLFDHNPSP